MIQHNRRRAICGDIDVIDSRSFQYLRVGIAVVAIISLDSDGDCLAGYLAHQLVIVANLKFIEAIDDTACGNPHNAFRGDSAPAAGFDSLRGDAEQGIVSIAYRHSPINRGGVLRLDRVSERDAPRLRVIKRRGDEWRCQPKSADIFNRGLIEVLLIGRDCDVGQRQVV